MGDIITFYSYKGGTGRSMALANIGYILAWQLPPTGKRILMIDWDLEAPGLHKFFVDELRADFSRVSGQTYLNELNAAPGLMDFLSDVGDFYRDNYRCNELAIKNANTPKSIEAFRAVVSAHPISNYILTVPRSGEYASADKSVPGLYLMKAGNQTPSTYIRHVRTFHWQDFYDRYGSFFTHLRELLAASYDIVLIDSRTGLTDIGDICTRVMPEKLVAVFAPNEQNIE